MSNLQKHILVIVPAHNEEEAIGSVLDGVHEQDPTYDVLVINDASFDKTEQIVRGKTFAKQIVLPINLGIGGAVQTGMKYACRNQYRYVVQFDGDGQHKAADIKKLINELEQNNCDVVIGSRFVSEGEGYKADPFRRIGIVVFELFSLLLIRRRIKDHTSGFRAFNRKALEFIVNEYPVDYPEPEIVVLLARNQFRIKEIFTQMYSRKGGISSIPITKGPYYMFKVLVSMFMAAIRPKEYLKRK